VKRLLKVVLWIIAAAIVILGCLVVYILAAWDRPFDRRAPELTAPRDSSSIARGEYLFKVTWQCYGCHQAGHEDSGAPPSGGRLFDLRSAGPGFGLFYSRNITPDSATGIGAWTDGEIVQALREGLNKSRHTLFPIMPTDWLKLTSDRDVLALVAYLRSLPPVHNPVPANEPSIVAKALFAFGILKPNPAITSVITAPPIGPTVEYGRYLATAGAACADCHTPRNLNDGSFYLDSLFTGSSFAYGDEEGSPALAYARNIRSHPTEGIGRWTEDEFVLAVTAGLRPDTTVLDPHMPYAQYKNLTPDDLTAIYRYLQSLSPIPRTVPPPRYIPAVTAAHGADRGKLLFAARCSACHGENGAGARVTSVQLAGVAPLYADADLRRIVSEGVIDVKMPAFRKTLTDNDISDIIAFIRTWKQE
jgi:mono/diheme cytochrome c family protein